MIILLVVEDDVNIVQLAVVNLNKRGYSTFDANTVQAGFELLKTHKPHMLILDLILPDGSGWDLLRAIDADPEMPKLPALIITAAILKDGHEYTYANLCGTLTK